MKKIVCIALVLMLSAVALAAGLPSKTSLDMMKFFVSGENLPEDAGFYFLPVNELAVGEENMQYFQDMLDVCQVELDKVSQAESVEAYFGEVADADGNAVDLDAALDVQEGETLNVYEFSPVVSGNYDASYGDVTVTMCFPTPYAIDEKVEVMLGAVTVNEDGTQDVDWTAFEGVGVASPIEDAESEVGAVQVVLDPASVQKVIDNVTLMGVVSK
ncbi:MAG: hypothetical protein IJH78_08385 [Clostridia bacterium]|nr:hypothetical protein [Clostridia bacterium]